MEYANYLIDRLIKLMAPIKRKDTIYTWATMVKQITNGEVGNGPDGDCQFYKIVPYVLQYVYKLITDVKDDIITCNTLLSLGINIFV